MDKQARLEALLEEAMVDCYGENAQFWGVFYTLEERLAFPLQARALGEAVTVVGLDDVEPDPVSAEWLEAYRYWLGE